MLVVFYLLVTAGVPVYLHYCGGELETVSCLVKKNGCCGEASDERMDCCMDQDLWLRHDPDLGLKPAGNFKFVQVCSVVYYLPLREIVFSLSESFSFYDPELALPPDPLHSEAYLSVFRI